MSEHRIKVLFVDDEEGNLKAFKATFRRDMDVRTATSGREALDLLEQEQVHVIISDQRMPGMNGAEFLAIARERHPRTMRMLLTGYADLDAVVSAVNLGGIYAYATKPWDENDLRLRIQQAYEIHQLRDDKDKLLHQYRQVFDASGDPIVLVDHKGTIFEANGACQKLMGMDRGALLSTRFTDHIDDPRALVRALRERRRGSEFLNVDLTLNTPSGHVIDCLMTATYLGRQELGRDVFQAIIKDVTDRKQEEQRLRKLNTDLDRRVAVRTSQLLEALEDLGSFSYSVAHDLRSPLKNIVALSEHLHAHAQDRVDEEAEAFTDRIQKGAQRMIELVDDMLRFSQTNNRELDRRPVLVHELAQEVIEEQVPAERRAQVHINTPPDATLLADAPLLKVVLHNLLSNAMKFTRERQEPRIEISMLSEAERDVLVVKDNGVGFDPEHKDQIFGTFKRLHKPDQFEGTGIGLAIVNRIVRKHGGTAWAESEPGVGTSMYIAVPRFNAANQALPFGQVA